MTTRRVSKGAVVVLNKYFKSGVLNSFYMSNFLIGRSLVLNFLCWNA